jgi:hypothetical protein
MKIRLFTLLIFICCSAHFGRASKIVKGYEALQQFNYFEAKKIFQKSLKKEPAPASYGLAIIYFRNDNPFHSLDSAFKYIGIAKSVMSTVKLKTKIKLEKFNYSDEAILDLDQQISKGYFNVCVKENTVECFSYFLKTHPQSFLIGKAIFKRDSIDFSNVKKLNTSIATKDFMVRYPETSFLQEAQNLFYKQQYFEYTNKETLISYLQFLNECKDSPYRSEAENKVYSLSTSTNTLKGFENFIKDNPTNRNVPEAWRKLNKIYMSDAYSDGKFEAFLKKYPEYPFGNELKNEELLSKLILLPIKVDDKWGYMNLDGKIEIPATYEEAGLFHEDFAAVVQNGKFGFISKANKFVVDPKFDEAYDFSDGRAIVELKDKMGLIDRNGFLIFDPIYDDIGPISEGKIYVKKDSLYGFYTKNKISIIPEKFEEVESFENNISRVRINGKEGIIDSVGSFVVMPLYDEIEFFSDSLLIYMENDKYGICNLQGQPILQANYDFIGELSESRAIFVDNGKIGYLDDSAHIFINPTFETYPNYQSFSNFKNGLAKTFKNGKYGLIDLNGKTFVPFNYSDISQISNLIAVKKTNKWGYLDEMGKEKIKPNYDYAESFKNGCGIVQKDSLMGVIDENEKFKITNAYSTISWFENTDFLLVESGQIYGLFDKNGNQLVPLIYQTIKKINDDFLVLKNGIAVDYFQIKERKLIQLKN